MKSNIKVFNNENHSRFGTISAGFAAVSGRIDWTGKNNRTKFGFRFNQ